MNEAENFDFPCQILLIGNSKVGKSTLLQKFANKKQKENPFPTMGVDFRALNCYLQETIIKLQIWDMSGREQYQELCKKYYRGAKGIIIMYDISDRKSFEDIGKWLCQIDQYASMNCDKLLVGNKSDLESERQITYEEGLKLANSLKIKFIEVSAEDSTDVHYVFNTIVAEVIQKQEEFDDQFKTVINKQEILKLSKKLASSCCWNCQTY